MKRLYSSLLITATILVLTAPMMAYLPARRLVSGQIVQEKWSSAALPIQWRMNPVTNSNVTGGREQAEVFRASFGAWQAVSTAAVVFSEGAAATATKQGLDCSNTISTNLTTSDFASGAIALAFVFSFDSTGVEPTSCQRNIEFAGQILETDIVFNPDFPFSTSDVTPTTDFDLQAVATHEIGHLVGLDHTGLMRGTMFPFGDRGKNQDRVLSTDDQIGVSTIYPASGFPASHGSISGTVQTEGGQLVYGALVVVVDANGSPVATMVTDPSGNYRIDGLEAGNYTAYAEPLDKPVQFGNMFSLSATYPGSIPLTDFITRFNR